MQAVLPPAQWKIGDRRVDMGHKMQPHGPGPGTPRRNVLQMKSHQLGNGGIAVDMRDQLQIDRWKG